MEPAMQRADGNGKLSLVRKLSEVMAAVERVPKSGRNDFHRYDYATEADIVAAVRLSMAERQVMIVPTVMDTKWGEVQRAKGGADRLCTLSVRFTLHDGESGEQLAFDVIGEGQDAGDKASYKAFTGAVKYALLKLFLIPTGDDPEADAAPSKGRGTHTQGTERAATTPAKMTQFPPKDNQAPATTPPPGSAAPEGSAAKERKPAARRTLDDAKKLDRSKELVGFGTHKSIAISVLSDLQLGEALDEGEDWVKQNLGYWNLNKMKNQIDLLTIEYEMRKRAAPQDDDVPF